MISKIERAIAFRYLKPKKKEGFLKIISIFSFTGIALGVAVLIIVMSVMNGFRTELINKILGFNPHIIVKPYENKIDPGDLDKLSELKNNIDVVFDDTEEHLSAKFKKFDLIGVPYQIILGSRSTDNKIEFKEVNGKTKTMSLEEIKNELLNKRNLN